MLHQGVGNIFTIPDNKQGYEKNGGMKPFIDKTCGGTKQIFVRNIFEYPEKCIGSGFQGKKMNCPLCNYILFELLKIINYKNV